MKFQRFETLTPDDVGDGEGLALELGVGVGLAVADGVGLGVGEVVTLNWAMIVSKITVN